MYFKWFLEESAGIEQNNLYTLIGLGESLGLKGDQASQPWRKSTWIFIGRTDAEAETPILWPPDAKNWLIWKDPDAGKDWRWEEQGMTEDEMVGWHHQLNGHEFEQAPGVGDGQGGLECCSSWGHKESDTTEQLNWTEYSTVYMYHYFIHSSMDGHLGFFHVLALVNSAVVNNGIHVSFSVLVSLRYMTRSGTAGSYPGFIPFFFFF